MSEIYMMVTICNRKQMQKFVKFYKQNHVDTGNISLAMGTAASDVLDYFGLEEDEKGIHFCLVTRPTWKTVKKGLQTELKIDVPGTGIVFLIPLSSIGGKQQLKFMLGEQEFEKGEETTLKETKHELIIAIANYGYNTQVMRAAEEGGATGGTVFHGKGVGMKRAEQFLGVSPVSGSFILPMRPLLLRLNTAPETIDFVATGNTALVMLMLSISLVMLPPIPSVVSSHAAKVSAAITNTVKSLKIFIILVCMCLCCRNFILRQDKPC